MAETQVDPHVVHVAHVAQPVRPNGRVQTVRPEELFFSTTDRRGIIRSGNSVFSRISGYPTTDLVGAPHNLVRHPDMPAGAFRIMWERLQSGRPMAAYVQNLARDGSAYWVFATVTPHGDGFLSVRMAPAGPLYGPARSLYETVRQYERDAVLRSGMSRAQAAEAGAARAESLLHGLGYRSYEEFMLDALPGEVAVRGSLVRTTFARPQASGPMATLLDAAGELDRRLEGLVAALEPYRDLVRALESSAETVIQHAGRLETSVLAAQRASDGVATTAPVLLNVATVMAGPMSAAVTALHELSPDLVDLRAAVAWLRFRIGLARLHVEMVAAFAAEAVDGLAPDQTLPEIPGLCDTLADGVAEMAREAGRVNQRLRESAAKVAAAGQFLDEFRRFLGQWRILVGRHRQGGALADLVAPIDDQLDAGHEQLDHLRELARSCHGAVVPLDTAALEHAVQQIRDASGYR